MQNHAAEADVSDRIQTTAERFSSTFELLTAAKPMQHSL
jgi:hypothetical protein